MVTYIETLDNEALAFFTMLELSNVTLTGDWSYHYEPASPSAIDALTDEQFSKLLEQSLDLEGF